MPYHLIAILPAGKKRTIVNKSEDEALSYVISFVVGGTITENWGTKPQTYQALELRIYQTKVNWNRKSGTSLEEFTKYNKNCFAKFKAKADKILGHNKYRVFIIMPIQGKKLGSQSEQRIYKEYDERYNSLKDLLDSYDCVAIRIDKEYPMEQIVSRIKEEIKKSIFVIADLTDERPSCYFEAGYAEGFKIPVIYVASEESAVSPGQKTKIHFDIHMNINFFCNLDELKEKVNSTIDKNKEFLFNKGNEILI